MNNYTTSYKLKIKAEGDHITLYLFIYDTKKGQDKMKCSSKLPQEGSSIFLLPW